MMELRPKFPHFKEHETRILREFLAKKELEGRYEFDVRLFPEIKPLEEGADPGAYYAWLMLRAKRIDALCETADTIWILEVKDVLRPSAVGQVLLYADVYDRQFHPLKPLRLGIVAGEDDPVVRPTCDRLGIKVWIMGIPSPRRRLLVR